MFSLAIGIAWGSEPAQEFLGRLREVGYFDTALDYLERADKMVGLTSDFKDAIPLEKAQTFIDAAVASRSAKERDEFFLSAQDQLKAFLAKKEHPRVSEARLLLGKLQMVRGSQLLAGKSPTDEARNASRESYMEAARTFDSIVADLKQTLEGLKGQRIDAAKEPEKVAQRDQYRYEFLQAQLRGAEARQSAAKTYENPLKDGKPLLEEALKSFKDLSEKYKNYVQGALAMAYRGQAQVDLGLAADAIDSFQRVLEQPADAEPLRPARMQSITSLINLWMAAKPARLTEAIQLGQSFVDTARPNEQRTQELQDLSIALAKAYIANADELKATGKKAAEEKRSTTNARQLLIAVGKVAGSHEDEAKALLAKVGIAAVESTEPIQAKEVKSLDEALAAAREYLMASEELTKMADLLSAKQKSGNDPEVAKELSSIDAQLDENRQGTIEVLRRGLAIGAKDTNLLNQARQFLSYALYQRKQFFEAAVVGQFLAKSAPNDSMGLQGGLLALSSLQSLMQSVDDQQSAALVSQIERLGEFLTKQWPDDPQAASAKGIMIRMALDKDRWDDAKKLLAEMPDGAEKANYKRLMGQLIWNRSLMLRQEKNTDEADALLPAAAMELREGLEKLPKGVVGPEIMQAALVLSKIELRRGDSAAALQVLDNKTFGPLVLIEKQDPPSPSFKSDLFSTELQAVVGVMTADGSDMQGLLNRATTTMEKLQGSVKGTEDSSDRLVKIYLGMARDIREQLDAATPERKDKLVGAFRVFLDSIAKSSEDPATLQWVGQTLMQMGESTMATGDVRAQGQAKELLSSATATLSGLITKQGDAASAPLKFQLAKAHRLNGEYKQAIDLLEGVLKKNAMMLDAQIEAATAYEQWAGTVDPKFAGKAYDSALRGARPGADGKNVIWGWGRVSKLVSGKEQFRDTFFESRYHVALCRYLMGKASNSNSVMEQAIADINQVAALYPELGGPEKRNQFDLLMKEIQKSLGKKADGLPPLQPVGG